MYTGVVALLNNKQYMTGVSSGPIHGTHFITDAGTSFVSGWDIIVKKNDL